MNVAKPTWSWFIMPKRIESFSSNEIITIRWKKNEKKKGKEGWRVKNRRRKMKDGEEGEERGEKRFDRGANLFKNKTGRFDKLSFRPL